MQPTHSATTNPSIFLRLNAQDERPREVAWSEFSARYVPVIRTFARNLGGKAQDIEDVVQDVLLGFFLTAPTFIYDPSKGRFRRYLKVCTYHALQKRFGKEARLLGKPLDEIDAESVALERVWNDAWEQQLLSRAIEQIRQEVGHTRTFAAFERCAVHGDDVHAVAEKLGMHINSVHRARDQITRLLKARLASLHDDE